MGAGSRGEALWIIEMGSSGFRGSMRLAISRGVIMDTARPDNWELGTENWELGTGNEDEMGSPDLGFVAPQVVALVAR